MSSCNFNVGLNDSERSSSRVLRPPGGVTSQLFGPVDEPTPVKTPAKPTLGGLQAEPNDNTTNENARQNKARQQTSSIFNYSEDSENQNPITPKDEADKPVVTPEEPQKVENGNTFVKHTRVPPGGHSSGFW